MKMCFVHVYFVFFHHNKLHPKRLTRTPAKSAWTYGWPKIQNCWDTNEKKTGPLDQGCSGQEKPKKTTVTHDSPGHDQIWV